MNEIESGATVCLNCKTPLIGNFCHSCGQSVKISRITFVETIKDFFSSTFALEGQLLFSIRSMIMNPGRMLREFISGKRKSYYKPVAFFVVLTALYLIVKALINYDPLQGRMDNINEDAPLAVQRAKEAAQYMVGHINNILIVLAFSIGINHKLGFWKRYNLAEYVVVGFYVTGVYIFLTTLFTLIEVCIFQIPRFLLFSILLIYIVYVSASFHQTKTFWAFTRYTLIAIFSLLCYATIGYGISYLIVSF
jgi:hypothetical protein